MRLWSAVQAPAMLLRMRCASCRYWFYMANSRDREPFGECRRFPPVRAENRKILLRRIGAAFCWPFTHEEGWCGEWAEARPEDDEVAGILKTNKWRERRR